MKKKLTHVQILKSYLHVNEEIGNSIEHQEVWEHQANAYNAISRYLESRGLADEAIGECMALVQDFKGSQLEYISYLYSANKLGGMDQCPQRHG